MRTRQGALSRFRILRDERGSVTPLVFSFFIISLLLVFLLINVVHFYVERRHLVLVLESALSKASQNLDYRYYYSGYVERNKLSLRGVSSSFRQERVLLPIDCESAQREFAQDFELQWTLNGVFNRSNSVNARESSRKSLSQVIDFGCDGKSLRATARMQVFLPHPIAFAGVNFVDSYFQNVSVEVGSVLRP